MRAFIDTNLWAYRLDGRGPEQSGRIASWLAEITRSRCEVLFSEDLSHRRKIGHLALINPLLESR